MESYSVLMSVCHEDQPEILKQSMQSILEQTVPADDFVLVCDGPLTPALDRVIENAAAKHPGLFQIVRLEESKGPGKALNIGISHCKNDLIARMDSDGIAMNDRCERQLQQFEADSMLDIVSGTVLEFDGTIKHVTAEKILPETDEEIHWYARKHNPFHHLAVMYRKTAVVSAGSYRDFPLFEDYYLWLRMMRNGIQAYNIPEALCWVRAGAEPYSRWGGFSYLKKTAKFRSYMLKNHFCNVVEYVSAIVGQAVICLLPAFRRKPQDKKKEV